MASFTIEAKGSEQQKGWAVMNIVVFHPNPPQAKPVSLSFAGSIGC